MGTYLFSGSSDEGEKSFGATDLSYALPAAPAAVYFDGSVISWEAGNDLGRCASAWELDGLVASGRLPVHPEEVVVSAWEIVLEPDVDVDDGDGLERLARYLLALPSRSNASSSKLKPLRSTPKYGASKSNYLALMSPCTSIRQVIRPQETILPRIVATGLARPASGRRSSEEFPDLLQARSGEPMGTYSAASAPPIGP